MLKELILHLLQDRQTDSRSYQEEPQQGRHRLTRKDVLRLIEENEGPEGLDLSGYDLSGANLIRLDLQGVVFGNVEPIKYADHVTSLKSANLERARLERANLQGANLGRVNLNFAHLYRADLSGATLWAASLEGADLGNATLTRADLYGAKLRDANLDGASLENANLHKADLSGASLSDKPVALGILQEGLESYRQYFTRWYIASSVKAESTRHLEARFSEAREIYLALKNAFTHSGRHNEASWAYRKERRMEKLEARQEAKKARNEHNWRGASRNYAKFATDQLVEWLCDYGEGIPNVLISLAVVYAFFTLVYGMTWSIMRETQTPTALILEPTRNVIDLARFSLGAMTTMESTGLVPRNGFVELLASLEALLGIALTGLLGFVLGNRIRRS